MIRIWQGRITNNGTNQKTYNFYDLEKQDYISVERIMLPVTDSGEPDYEYMEQYAKNMMIRKYKQYLTFADRAENKKQ